MRHEAGHVVVDTMFSNEFSSEKDLPDTVTAAFSIDIDDCDCHICEANRGSLQMYATMGLSIHTKEGIHTQRLLPEEARYIADILYRFADVIDHVSEVDPNEWVSKEEV